MSGHHNKNSKSTRTEQKLFLSATLYLLFDVQSVAVKLDKWLSGVKGWWSQKFLSPHLGVFCILSTTAFVQWSHPCTPQKPCHPSTFTRPHRDRECGWGKGHTFWWQLGRAWEASPTQGPAASAEDHPSCVDGAAGSNTKWKGECGEATELHPLLRSVRGENECCC